MSAAVLVRIAHNAQQLRILAVTDCQTVCAAVIRRRSRRRFRDGLIGRLDARTDDIAERARGLQKGFPRVKFVSIQDILEHPYLNITSCRPPSTRCRGASTANHHRRRNQLRQRGAPAKRARLFKISVVL